MAAMMGGEVRDRARAVAEFADGGAIAVADIVRTVGARTFVLQDDVWTDTSCDASHAMRTPTC